MYNIQAIGNQLTSFFVYNQQICFIVSFRIKFWGNKYWSNIFIKSVMYLFWIIIVRTLLYHKDFEKCLVDHVYLQDNNGVSLDSDLIS